MPWVGISILILKRINLLDLIYINIEQGVPEFMFGTNHGTNLYCRVSEGILVKPRKDRNMISCCSTARLNSKNLYS